MKNKKIIFVLVVVFAFIALILLGKNSVGAISCKKNGSGMVAESYNTGKSNWRDEDSANVSSAGGSFADMRM